MDQLNSRLRQCICPLSVFPPFDLLRCSLARMAQVILDKNPRLRTVVNKVRRLSLCVAPLCVIAIAAILIAANQPPAGPQRMRLLAASGPL